jgi:glycogen debranching enzyme
LYEERNPDGDGLVIVVHPWESGTDNAPPYLAAGKRVHMTYRPQYKRLDTLQVSAANRPTDKDYDLFVYLLEQMRKDNWDQKAYLEHAPLQIGDVLFNSVLCRADLDLASIADVIGEDTTQPRRWYEQTKAAVNARCWDDSDGMYYDYDRVAGHLIKIDTIAGLHTLFGQIADESRAQRMVEVHLANPRMFWPPSGYPVPTTSLSSEWFNPENYWLGPVWVSINWMLAHGLSTYGRSDLAAVVTTRTLDLVSRSGYHEYFNPFTGAGYGTGNFSWTAALAIDFIAEMGENV